MDNYRVRVVYNQRTLLAIFVLPLLLSAVLILGTLYGPKLPEWTILPIVAVSLSITIAVTLYLLKKTSPKATVELDGEGFHVRFDEQNFYTPDSFEIKMSELVNYYAYELSGNTSLSFKTSVKPAQFNFTPAGKSTEEMASFDALMEVFQEKVDKNNQLEAGEKKVISTKSIYETWWARALFLGVVIMLVTFSFLKLVSDAASGVSWLRLLVLVFLSAPFLMKVYSGLKKK